MQRCISIIYIADAHLDLEALLRQKHGCTGTSRSSADHDRLLALVELRPEHTQRRACQRPGDVRELWKHCNND